jgi:hypothetical protein
MTTTCSQFPNTLITSDAICDATMSSAERFADDGVLRVATWNVAAINNNPFEYGITHDDPAYNQLMLDVESLIDDPGDLDLTVGQILDETIMLDLFSHLRAEGFGGVEETVEYWRCNLKDRRYGRMF